MTEREKLIEAMARAWMNRDGCGYEGLLCNDARLDGQIDERGRPIKAAKDCTCYEGATAALAAIEAAGAVIVPVEATDDLLMSMAVRYDHGLGVPGYYDQPMILEASKVSHELRLESTMATMRQLHEEVVGKGFYRPASPYRSET